MTISKYMLDNNYLNEEFRDFTDCEFTEILDLSYDANMSEKEIGEAVQAAMDLLEAAGIEVKRTLL